MDFTYKAKNKKGEEQKGEITAENQEMAVAKLSKLELYVTDISGVKNDFFKSGFFKKKVSLKDKIIFTKEMAIMTRGGLSLIESLDSLKQQAENPEFKKVIGVTIEDVRGGMSLSKAFAKHPEVFSELYIAIVSSGERSGKLDDVLERLAEQLQKDYDLITKVKSAITYPIVIVTALFGTVILMLVFVVPKMKSIFDGMGVALPLPTRILLAMSGFVVNQWYVVLAVIIVLIILIRLWAKTQKGAFNIDKFKISVPIFGSITKKIYLARFARTTATLINSGLPMLDVIETDKTVVGNKFYLPIFNQISKDVESGIPLSAGIKKHKIFPVMISQMISVGEKSGKIDEILIQLADFYDKEVEASTASMASLIEPILIIIIGVGIGLAIISVIMPIYSLVNVI